LKGDALKYQSFTFTNNLVSDFRHKQSLYKITYGNYFQLYEQIPNDENSSKSAGLDINQYDLPKLQVALFCIIYLA
jgi:hypothetical protein